MSEAFTGLEGGWSGEPIQPRLPPPEPGDAAGSVTPPKSREESGLSSVEIHETAKAEPRLKVRVYAESNSFEAVDSAANHAVDLYRRLRAQVRSER